MADINIGQFSEALNDKMDRDSNNANPKLATYSEVSSLSNTVSTLQAVVAELQEKINNMLGRIDYNNIVTGTINTNTTYTIPSDGYIRLVKTGSSVSSGYYYVRINGVDVTERLSGSGSPTYIGAVYYGDLLAVAAGDIITNKGGSSGPALSYTFYPQKS